MTTTRTSESTRVDEPTFRRLARNYLIEICVCFVACAVFWMFLWSVHHWAEESDSWQARVVNVLFYFLGAADGFATLILGALTYAWIHSYRMALREVRNSEVTREQLHRAYHEVVGPIRWR